MSNTFSRGAKNILGGDSPLLVTGLGQSRDRDALDTLSASAQFVPLPADAGWETCWRIVVLLVFIA